MLAGSLEASEGAGFLIRSWGFKHVTFSKYSHCDNLMDLSFTLSCVTGKIKVQGLSRGLAQKEINLKSLCTELRLPELTSHVNTV